MNNTRRALAFFAMSISVVALLLAAIGGSVLVALEGFVQIFAHNSTAGPFGYPLGRGIVVVYVFGAALGVAAFYRPMAAGIAMLPLGAGAYLLGGPVAQVYGIVIACTGIVFLATGPRRGNA